MKKDKMAITAMSFALINDHFNDKMKKHLSSEVVDTMTEFIATNMEKYPLTQVRNYGTVRNKLAREFNSYSPMALVSVLDTLSEQFDIVELDNVVSNLHGEVPGSGLEETDLRKAVSTFKFIVIGKR